MLNSNKWIFALIICFIIVKNSSGLPSDSSLRGHGDKCSKHSDCASINGRCSRKKKCVCNPSYNFLFPKCTATLGARCEKPSDCNIQDVSCLDNKCFCPENMHLARNKTSCIKNAIAIGDFCEQAEDCQNVEHSHCSTSSGNCECVNNYFEQDEQCVKGIDADCKQKSECKVRDSECIEKKCRCLKNMHLDRNGTSCIKNATVPFDFCEKDDDCSAVMHTTCEDNTCECQDQYFASNDKCVAELGAPCNKPTDCNIENVSCSDRKCSCPENMHLAGNKTSCIRNATAPLDFCENDGDCSFIMHTSCVETKCKCKDQYFANSGKCVAKLGTSCSDPTDCNIDSASCSDNKCFCPENMHLAVNKTSCIKNATAPGDFCEQAEDCQKVMYSNCSSSKCECIEKYVKQDKQCVATIETPCEQDKDCQLSKTLCYGNTCQCEKQYVALSNKQCMKISSYGNPCTDRKQCVCENYPSCFLNDTYIDLVCSEKCKCPINYHYIPEKFSCVHTAEALDDSCDTDDNCKLLRYSICSNKQCACAKNHFVQNGECVKGIGADCSHDSNCRVISSLCLASKCSCPKNMHLALNGTSCIKNAIVPFDFCEKHEDCSAIKHTSCVGDKCKCQNQFFASNDKCVAELGAPCNKPTDCNIENASCLGKKCSCPENMHLAANKTSCIKNAAALNDFCEKNEDCNSIMYTNCVKNQCVCTTNYSPKNGKCVGNLGASCSNSADCDTEKNSKCVDNKCVCIENYFSSDGRCKQGLNTHCSRDDDCSAVMNARCIKETCNCMVHNVQVSTERCMPVSSFNEECDFDIQCTELTPNAVCKSLHTPEGGKRKCQCSAGQHYQGNGCYAIKKLGENCDNLYECFVTSNPETVTCQAQCVCAEKFKKLNDTFCSGAESIVASILLIISMFTIKYIF